ncbi:pumilio/PUF RNA binding protein 7 [Angomonas deanei]|nr:pumilio/PUF RNA binding protein 7 [Angomonas deanei]|eukprot:EPY38965.1 pumilio/PUF RNA binding protein 7 [Angomonas deanei]
MKLNFLKNPLQRIATGKSLPLKQVEAIIKYGRPEQRAKVVEKLLPSTYGLALNTKTHHILITCLEYCDNMDRVKMLYNVRRKILDLSKSPVGNVFVQKLVEKLPLKQKQEVAEMFTLNCDVEEFAQLCEHPFGNHVAQKLVEIPVCIDILRPVFLPYFNRLLRSEYGVRVVAKFISSAGDGWFDVLTAQFPDIPWNREELDDMEWTEEQLAYVDVQVAELCRTNKDSMAVSALIQHILVPNEIKDAICAHLSEFAEEYLNPKEGEAPAAGKDEEGEEDFSLPDFGGGGAVTIKKADANVPRQAYCYCQLFQYGDDAQRGELWNAIKTLLPVLYTKKETVPILVAAFKFFEESREEIRNQLFLSFPEKKKLAVEEVATNPQRTLVFRVIIETEADLIPPQTVAQLIKESYELCKSPTASPVLQKIALHYAGGDYGKDMYKHLKPHLEELVNHNCASYLIQALLDTPDTGLRSSIIRDLIVLYEDRLAELAAFQCGSRVLQKLCTLLDNESISGFVDKLIAMAEKDEDVEEAEENDDDDEEKTEGQEGEKRDEKKQGGRERGTRTSN